MFVSETLGGTHPDLSHPQEEAPTFEVGLARWQGQSKPFLIEQLSWGFEEASIDHWSFLIQSFWVLNVDSPVLKNGALLEGLKRCMVRLLGAVGA